MPLLIQHVKTGFQITQLAKSRTDLSKQYNALDLDSEISRISKVLTGDHSLSRFLKMLRCELILFWDYYQRPGRKKCSYSFRN